MNQAAPSLSQKVNAPEVGAANAAPSPGLFVRLLPLFSFAVVFILHALYLRRLAALPTDGWADSNLVADSSLWGLKPYLEGQDYFMGFSYALGAAFAVWAVGQFIFSRQKAAAAGAAAGSLTLVGALMAGGCFLIGCCGSPMLGVYMGIFGAKALGAGKPLMAVITLLSTGCGYRCLSRRFAKGGCVDECCK